MCSCVVRTEPYLHNLAISASPNKATVTRQRQLAFGLAPQLPEGDRLQGNDERCCQSMPGETVLSSYRTSTGLITCVFANRQASEHICCVKFRHKFPHRLSFCQLQCQQFLLRYLHLCHTEVPSCWKNKLKFFSAQGTAGCSLVDLTLSASWLLFSCTIVDSDKGQRLLTAGGDEESFSCVWL